MKLQEAINKYFSRDNIIDNICKYQLYYQIGLATVMLKSIQDLDEAHKKLSELDLQIDSNKVFESVHEIVLYLSNNDDFEEKFESHLRFTALAQMLNDFVDSDKELLNSKPFTDIIYEDIKNDTFFTDDMKQQFNIDYDAIIPTWEATISEEIANDIKSVVMEIFNKN
ncbi:MAG: hypothetical protein U9R16_05020 [Campylobacterota bacterium]|nr:hypothetical protein [Campylobacterota bacterium]